jgi:hypothetical protein
VAPDDAQVLAVVATILHFGWEKVTLLHAEDDYGKPFADGVQSVSRRPAVSAFIP